MLRYPSHFQWDPGAIAVRALEEFSLTCRGKLRTEENLQIV